MGSPLGLIIADVFLCQYEKEWLDNFFFHVKPLI